MKRFLTYAILLLSVIGCSKDSYDAIPDVAFNDYINLSSPLYNYQSFTVKYGLNGYRFGTNGVVVYYLRTGDPALAFDLMCPYCYNAKSLYRYTELNNQGDYSTVCPECGSEYNISSEYGSVLNGPAEIPLKSYQTSVSGDYLTIWNN